MKNNTDKNLYYRNRAEDFEAYTAVAWLVGLILLIPLDGVLCSIVGEDNGKNLAGIVVLVPILYISSCYLYYSFRADKE